MPDGIPPEPGGEGPAPTLDRLVVLDVEATCEEGGPSSPQEIIELPSVLLSLASLTVLDEFQSFVRPQHHPRLSAFCRDLTGITQRDVDGADPFPAVLERHLAWLRSHRLAVSSEDAEGPSFVLATCGDWDLGTMFPNQCRDAIPPAPLLPRPFRRWVNVKQVFAAWRGSGKAPGMAGMLRALGLPLIGRHHRGIDDCRNIARLVVALVERGAPIAVTTVLPINRHPPLSVVVRLGHEAGTVSIGQRSVAAILKRSETHFRRPIVRVRLADRPLDSDEDLIDVPTGATLTAESG
jgi:inhibitor of KinA sporulation pathway (predicted exonuclease)